MSDEEPKSQFNVKHSYAGGSVPEKRARKPARSKTEPSQPAEARKPQTKTLYDKKGLRYALRLDLVDDGVELRGWIYPKAPNCGITPEAILDILNQNGIKKGIDYEGIKAACETANTGEDIVGVAFASGDPPTHGADGYFKFLAKPTEKRKEFDSSEQENVDYHHLHLFDNVNAGQRIAEIIPCTKGVSGVSVIGDAIPANDGAPMAIDEITIGENVRGAENGGFEAKISGRVEYDAKTKTISVTDQYVIDGDAGFNTGDIDFIGFVEIKRDVIKDFNIKAGKDIKIGGNVEACRLEAGGDIEIGGGVSGQEYGFIKCGGRLTARYLDGVGVECDGPIVVKNEIVKCHVKCGETIQVTSGAIVGGECVAHKGVEAIEFGSESGAKTLLIAGPSFVMERDMEEMNHRIEELDDFERQLDGKLDWLVKDPTRLDQMEEKERNRMKKMGTMLRRVLEERKELKSTLADAAKKMKAAANPMFNVKSKVYPNTRLGFGGSMTEIKEPVLKPSTIIKNSTTGGLRFAQLRSLRANARMIESEILRQEAAAKRKAETTAAVA